MVRTIPIQNVYYLLLYAWDRLPEGRTIDVAGIAVPDLPNLLAKILLDGVGNVLRRGIDRGYVENSEDLRRPRGRMQISDTIRRNLSCRAEIACGTDELSRDVLHNRIIKTTLERFLNVPAVDHQLHEKIVSTVWALSDIQTISLRPRDFGLTQLHANNSIYGLLLKVCALAYEALVPEPGSGRFRFRDVLAEPQEMGLIFQHFVRNFFRLEQDRFSVKGEQIYWPIEHTVGHGHELMPVMSTDASLDDGKRTIIIECKWTPTTLQTSHGVKRLRSEHLYQLSAYIHHHRRAKQDRQQVEGVLLYPLVDDTLDVAVNADGQWIRARTIDFQASWQRIRAQLLSIIPDE